MILLTWMEYDLVMLALTMWREAQGEGREGMRAVGHVIRNRVLNGSEPWDVVITKKWQFSSISVLGDGETIDWPDRNDPQAKQDAWVLAMQLAGPIFEGTDEDITSGSLWYFNPAATPPTSSFWASVANNPECEKVLTLGHHEFYAKKKVA